MHLTRLKKVESEFLTQYPGGFSHPAMEAIGKKHQIPKRVEQSQAYFTEQSFTLPKLIVDNVYKTIARSSLVSRFEKPRLRDWLKIMTPQEKEYYALSLRDMLHGDQEYGFNMMVSLLSPGQIAKWPIITVIPFYYAPQKEVFVKPTTTKSIINYFELKELQYKPKPSFEFYHQYRKKIVEMKSKVDTSLKTDNAAFCGFLTMMTQ